MKKKSNTRSSTQPKSEALRERQEAVGHGGDWADSLHAEVTALHMAIRDLRGLADHSEHAVADRIVERAGGCFADAIETIERLRAIANGTEWAEYDAAHAGDRSNGSKKPADAAS